MVASTKLINAEPG